MRSNTKVLPLIAVAIILVSIQAAMFIWTRSVKEPIKQPVDIQLENPQSIQIDPIREKQEKFVKKYGNLTDYEIQMLLDTRNENAKNPILKKK